MQNKVRGIILVSACALLLASPAWALTGAEVLNDLNEDERAGYLAGNVDMAAQFSYRDGQRERSDCIFAWFYEQDGMGQIVQALERFKDQQVQPVIFALINRACGE